MNVTTGEKMYAGSSPDGQYSYYLSPYICWKFVNLFDAQGSGKVFLFDEVHKKQLGSCEVQEISLMDAPVFWENKLYFKSDEVAWNAGTPFILPREVSALKVRQKLPEINQKFPFGTPALSNLKSPIKWEADPQKYGHYLPHQGIDFDQLITSLEQLRNPNHLSIVPIKIKKALPFNDFNRNHTNYDQTAAQALEVCHYRLPNINGMQCYYFTSQSKQGNTYGNLCFYDELKEIAHVINVYFQYSGDQHVNYRFFQLDNQQLLLYDGACYDDGCYLNPSFKIDFAAGNDLEVIPLGTR